MDHDTALEENIAGSARAGWARLYFTSSVGRKAIMAVTGIILTLFVIGHMLGNLQLFMGEEAINRYARFLRIEPPLLWTVRLVLLAAVVLHIITGFQLWLENRRARPEKYVAMGTVQATIASRTMIYTGLLVMGFVVYHLLHLTLHALGPQPGGGPPAGGSLHGEVNVYRNVVAGFQDPFISILYIVGQLLLYFHLSHGIQSTFQTLGFSHPKYDPAVKRLGYALSFIIVAANISMPIAVLAGLVR